MVVGADGAATFGNVSQTTIQQPIRKLSIVDGHIIVGTSGPIAIGQAYTAEITKLSKGNFKKSPDKILTDINQAVWPHIEREWKCAEVVSKLLGPQVAAQSALSGAVVAMSVYGQGSLFQFNHQCSPEEATLDLPFIAIGSGQALADPFLAFLRRIFWPKILPNLAEGILATLWALEHAILTNAGGVSKPVQIIKLSKAKDNSWNALELSDEELGEHRQNMNDAERALANYRKGQQASDESTSIPQPPVPKPTEH